MMYLIDRAAERARTDSDEGQTTAEYAIVLTAAAGVVGMFIAWIQSSDKVANLFDRVFNSLIGAIG